VVHQKFKAETQELEKDLKTVRQSNGELFAGEMKSHMELVAKIKKVIDESEDADKARRMNYSHEQTGTMLFGMLSFRRHAREKVDEREEVRQSANDSSNHSESRRPAPVPPPT
jgi:hypothetical protein